MGGGDSGSCCSCGGTRSGFNFFCFQWWWPVVASRGCGFAKKVVGFQRKGETKRKKQENKKTIFK